MAVEATADTSFGLVRRRVGIGKCVMADRLIVLPDVFVALIADDILLKRRFKQLGVVGTVRKMAA